MLTVMLGVCDGLEFIHSIDKSTKAPNFHGNLTPQNVFFSPGHQVKIRGYGRGNDWKPMTMSDTHIYSFPFYSANVLSGGRVTPKDDIYSLGMLLYMGCSHLNNVFKTMIIPLKEAALFDGVDESTFAGKLMRKLVNESGPPPFSFANGTADSLKKLIEKCCRHGGDLSIGDIREELMGKVRKEIRSQVDKVYKRKALEKRGVAVKQVEVETNVKKEVAKVVENGVIKVENIDKPTAAVSVVAAAVDGNQKGTVDQLIEEIDLSGGESDGDDAGSEISL